MTTGGGIVTGTVWELTANGFFTRNGSAPLNVIAATGTRQIFMVGLYKIHMRILLLIIIREEFIL